MKRLFFGLCIGAVGCVFGFHSPAAANGKREETILHVFGNGTDGAGPARGLIDVKGALYGTTDEGGANGLGTVFTIDPKTGAETVVYSFMGGTDGAFPYSDLIDVNGTLYGTTIYSGAGSGCINPNGCGTVFALDLKTGAETVLYSFCDLQNCSDGYGPEAGLIDVNGKLYGTTFDGGPGGEGTVFSVNPKTGAEAVVYSFKCCDYDAASPLAGLIDVNGTLYGTTFAGGANSTGTVFSVNPKTGAETVVYSFCSQENCADGGAPEASLIDVSGLLYGTTAGDGMYGAGTLFSLDPGTGKITVLHAFGGCVRNSCKDGYAPVANLIDVNGLLYGTTSEGGTGKCDEPYRCGTVYSFDPANGAERIVYSFLGNADGEGPDGGLTAIKGTLYGTTDQGGNYGRGIVFALRKP